MNADCELPQFLEWMARQSRVIPLAKEAVLGKVLQPGEKPPKFGPSIHKTFGNGTLSVWPDAVILERFHAAN